jgi:hypothetical protein
VLSGKEVESSGAFACFLKREVTAVDFRSADRQKKRLALNCFARLDDSDILCTIKDWITDSDPVLSDLSDRIINRKLMKIKISPDPFSESQVNDLKEKVMARKDISSKETDYFISVGEMTNNAYRADEEAIMILYKNGKLKDIRDASDINLEGLSKTVRKHFVCYPAKIS